MKLNPSVRESFLHGFLEQRDKRCSVTALCGERPTQWVYAQGLMLGHPPGKPKKSSPKGQWETKQIGRNTGFVSVKSILISH